MHTFLLLLLLLKVLLIFHHVPFLSSDRMFFFSNSLRHFSLFLFIRIFIQANVLPYFRWLFKLITFSDSVLTSRFVKLWIESTICPSIFGATPFLWLISYNLTTITFFFTYFFLYFHLPKSTVAFYAYSFTLQKAFSSIHTPLPFDNLSVMKPNLDSIMLNWIIFYLMKFLCKE